MTKRTRFSPEVQERAVRLVQEHRSEYETEWGAITPIASKIGCSAETLRKWVRRTERDTGRRPGVTTDEQARVKALERENRELRRTHA
jgi:transposase